MTLIAQDPTASFPHAVLTTIVGKPTFATTRLLKKQLVANAISVYSARGTGTLGHAKIVLGQEAYDALAGDGNEWIDPVNPGPAPVYPDGATQHQIIATKQNWENSINEWKTFNAVEAALKRLLLDAVDTTWLSSLEDPLFGYTNVSCADLLHHLETTYAVVDSDALTTNMDELKAPWEPSESMEPLWLRGVQAQQLAAQGGVPITDAHLLLIFRDLLIKSGQFTLDLREWDKLPNAQKTLAAFKTTFTEANNRRIKTLTTNQLATASPMPAHAFAARSDILNTPNTTPIILAHGASTVTKLAYCWTHGVTTNVDHTSRTCTSKATGHQEDATIDNMMGGNNTIRRRPRERNIFLAKNPNRRQRATPTSPTANAATPPNPSTPDSAVENQAQS